jgi:hypothetical protein
LAMNLQSGSPASALSYMKYPPVVTIDKLTKETGFLFRCSTEATLSSFVSATIIPIGQNVTLLLDEISKCL